MVNNKKNKSCHDDHHRRQQHRKHCVPNLWNLEAEGNPQHLLLSKLRQDYGQRHESGSTILQSFLSILLAVIIVPTAVSFLPWSENNAAWATTESNPIMLDHQTRQVDNDHFAKPKLIANNWRTSHVKNTMTRGSSELLAASANTQSPPSASLPNLLRSDKSENNIDADNRSMLEEVWNLVNKYYLDPTFHGQDWNVVHDQYRQLLQKHQTVLLKVDDENVEYDITNRMLQSLHDKYTRLLDTAAYASIQKYDLIGVGVTLMPNSITKQIQVGAPPVPQSASDRAGLRVGDYVDAINGIPTQGRTAFDIIDQWAKHLNFT